MTTTQLLEKADRKTEIKKRARATTEEVRQAIVREQGGDTTCYKLKVSKDDQNACFSMYNHFMIFMQGGKPGIYGTFNQWKEAGKTVKKGEHCYYLAVYRHYEQKNEQGEITDEGSYFPTACYFHASQVE